ncbi:MAG: DUF6298 domain-containing protein [Pirellulales bacterium]
MLIHRLTAAWLAATAVLLSSRVSAAGEPSPEAKTVKPAAGPLRVHPQNPRYFTDGSGRAVYLTGAHTWANLVDIGPQKPSPGFDFDAYLKFLAQHHHNFVRLWTWEPVTWNTKGNGQDSLHAASPQPYARTGPGKALDGKPKFDLTKDDAEYFSRLRHRVQAAQDRGIYVSIMLFEGWAMQFSPGAWQGHPYNPANNVNNVNGDTNGDGNGLEIYTLASPAVTAIEEAYVRKVVDTVNDLDNVLYEISNENHPPSTKWQYHVIRFIKEYEKAKPKQHPVGMTFQYKDGSNRTLLESPADWISPNPQAAAPYEYRDNPPPADGKKVILSDTDHLWGIGGSPAWVWKSFLRGLNPLFMDPYDGVVLGPRADSKWDPVRRNLGYALRYAERMNLAAMTPRGDLASTKYCLANAAKQKAEYLVYLPEGGSVTVDLGGSEGSLAVEWLDPRTGKTTRGESVAAGAKRQFTAPFAGDAVLYLR